MPTVKVTTRANNKRLLPSPLRWSSTLSNCMHKPTFPLSYVWLLPSVVQQTLSTVRNPRAYHRVYIPHDVIFYIYFRSSSPRVWSPRIVPARVFYTVCSKWNRLNGRALIYVNTNTLNACDMYIVQMPKRRREGCFRHHLLWDSELYMHFSCHAKCRGRMLNFERGNWQSRCSRFAKRLCELRFTNNNSQHHVCYSLLTCLLAADLTLLAADMLY